MQFLKLAVAEKPFDKVRQLIFLELNRPRPNTTIYVCVVWKRDSFFKVLYLLKRIASFTMFSLQSSRFSLSFPFFSLPCLSRMKFQYLAFKNCIVLKFGNSVTKVDFTRPYWGVKLQKNEERNNLFKKSDLNLALLKKVINF